MKRIKKILFLITLIFVMTSCDANTTRQPSSSSLPALAEYKEKLSPFTQFGNLERDEMGFDSEQVDNILRTYGIYDDVLEKLSKEDAKELYVDSICNNVKINGFNVGNKKVAVMMINKGHLYIYLMFSNSNDEWMVDGFSYLIERIEPEYRLEQSSDGNKYWLVVKHEANHGTGLYIFNEIWYNPDGSVAAEYPIEGSTFFLPGNIDANTDTYFSGSAEFDGDTKIYLTYRVSFEYSYDKQKDNFYRFRSKYSPSIQDYWEYDLKTRRLEFKSSDSELREDSNAIEHKASPDYGILQGYIDYYKTKIGDKKITTLEEWEEFVGLK